ncbi:MAG: hypothetical protein KDD70_06755 [Bdellovibrionales bacterium]|nr:hypothetical protein [Bdellovibrionales bacterium]
MKRRHLLTTFAISSVLNPLVAFASPPLHSVTAKIFAVCEESDDGDEESVEGYTAIRFRAEIVSPSSDVTNAIQELKRDGYFDGGKVQLVNEQALSADEEFKLLAGKLGAPSVNITYLGREDDSEFDLSWFHYSILILKTFKAIAYQRDFGVPMGSEEFPAFTMLTEYYCSSKEEKEVTIKTFHIPVNGIDALLNIGALKKQLKELLMDLFFAKGPQILKKTYSEDCGYLTDQECPIFLRMLWQRIPGGGYQLTPVWIPTDPDSIFSKCYAIHKGDEALCAKTKNTVNDSTQSSASSTNQMMDEL